MCIHSPLIPNTTYQCRDGCTNLLRLFLTIDHPTPSGDVSGKLESSMEVESVAMNMKNQSESMEENNHQEVKHGTGIETVEDEGEVAMEGVEETMSVSVE